MMTPHKKTVDNVHQWHFILSCFNEMVQGEKLLIQIELKPFSWIGRLDLILFHLRGETRDYITNLEFLSNKIRAQVFLFSCAVCFAGVVKKKLRKSVYTRKCAVIILSIL